MPDEDIIDAGPAAQGDPPEGGAPNLDLATLEKLIGSAVAKATSKMADTVTGLQAELEKQAENRRNQIRRLKSGGVNGVPADGEPVANPEQGVGGDSDLKAELEAYRERVKKLEEGHAKAAEQSKSARIDRALSDALDPVQGLRDGVKPHIRKLIRDSLTENSRGEVVMVEGDAHVFLDDVIERYSSDPVWQAPPNRGGGGKPGSPMRAGGMKTKTVSNDDLKAKSSLIDEIASGEVVVTD